MRVLLSVICLIGCARAALGDVLLVSPVGLPLQTVIDRAADGDTIVLGPGVYAGPVTIQGKSIELIGAGADATVIDGRGLGSVLTAYGDPETSTLLIEGITFTGGDAENGGGLYLAVASALVRECEIAGNAAQVGGGVYAALSVEFRAVRIEGNTAMLGGGLAVAADADVHVQSCVINDNAAQQGGGIYIAPAVLEQTWLDVVSSRLDGNTADFGGGIAKYAGHVLIERCDMTQNLAHVTGGAVFASGDGDVAFSETSAWLNGAGAKGGGVFCGPGVVGAIIQSDLIHNVTLVGRTPVELDAEAGMIIGQSRIATMGPEVVSRDFHDMGANEFIVGVAPGQMLELAELIARLTSP